MKKLAAGLLSAILLASVFTGCTTKNSINNSTNANAIFKAKAVLAATEDPSDEDLRREYSKFIFELFQHCAKRAGEGQNVCLSADSVLFCLDMVAAGADGDTLDQMLQTMVPNSSNDAALGFGAAHMNELMGDNVTISNSVWINKVLSESVFDDYKEYVTENFDAEVNTVNFGSGTVDAINKWVNDKTKGRIPMIINDLSDDDLMVLVNAITFDGTWELGYAEDDIYETTFFGASGEQDATFLYSNEKIFVCNETSTGFIKPYEGGKFGFMAILPDDENIDINEYVQNMTSDDYWYLWDNQKEVNELHCTMPCFEMSCEYQLTDILQDMGMKDAFSTNANFSNMTSGNAWISQVVHKTFIHVDSKGTEAAAATAATMTCSIVPDMEYVTCNRPYAYAIVDMDTGLPLFIGTVANV